MREESEWIHVEVHTHTHTLGLRSWWWAAWTSNVLLNLQMHFWR